MYIFLNKFFFVYIDQKNIENTQYLIMKAICDLLWPNREQVARQMFLLLKEKKEFFRPIAKDNPRKPLKEAYFHWGPRSFF